MSPAGAVSTDLFLSSATCVTRAAALWGQGCCHRERASEAPGKDGLRARVPPTSFSHTWVEKSKMFNFGKGRSGAEKMFAGGPHLLP